MEAYFDNSATTRVLDEVKDIVVKVMTEDYGNPSAKHRKGMEAEQYVRRAAEEVAKTLKVKEKEILFTSGGTESNNMALIGTAMANARAGKHIITTRIEHASVYNPMAFLEQQGFEVTYLHVDGQGHISLEELKQSLRPDTILVSVMYVNNEIGAVEPVEEIAALVHRPDPLENGPADLLRVKASLRADKYPDIPASLLQIHGARAPSCAYGRQRLPHGLHPLLLLIGNETDAKLPLPHKGKGLLQGHGGKHPGDAASL